MVIGLVGAMNEEINLFLLEMKVKEVLEYAEIRFFKGKLAGVQVVVCMAGVGKVNAALATQILIDLFQVDLIIFSGVAGALHNKLKVGDIVVSRNTQQYDVNFTAIGFPYGVNPSLKTSIFVADPRLVLLAEKAAQRMIGKVLTGKILSGDSFVACREQAMFLVNTFGGLCVEAEGAAVGQVCFLNKIPFVIVRGISDRADQSASKDFETFVKIAGHRAQVLVLIMLKLLG